MRLDSRRKLAELLKQIRGKETLTSFGKRLGVSYMAVSKWENCAAVPDTDNLSKIAHLSGLSLESLLDYLGEGNDKPQSSIDQVLNNIHHMNQRQLALVGRAVSDRLLAIAESTGR